MPLASGQPVRWLNLGRRHQSRRHLNIKPIPYSALHRDESSGLSLCWAMQKPSSEAEAAILGYGGSLSADNITMPYRRQFFFLGVSSSALATYQSTNGIKFGTSGTGFSNFLGSLNFSIPQTDINQDLDPTMDELFPRRILRLLVPWSADPLSFFTETNPGRLQQLYGPSHVYGYPDGLLSQ